MVDWDPFSDDSWEAEDPKEDIFGFANSKPAPLPKKGERAPAQPAILKGRGAVKPNTPAKHGNAAKPDDEAATPETHKESRRHRRSARLRHREEKEAEESNADIAIEEIKPEPPPEPKPEDQPPPEPEPPDNRRKILIIDDNLVVRRNHTLLLEKFGFNVLEAVDGKDGIERLCSVGADAVSIIMVDLMMPVMNGEQFVSIAKKAFGDALPPIFVCTVSGEELVVKNMLSMGIAGYILKPVDFKKLAIRLQSLFPDMDIKPPPDSPFRSKYS